MSFFSWLFKSGSRVVHSAGGTIKHAGTRFNDESPEIAVVLKKLS